jgi:tetratricopeptide (TPR) repeat protein
VTVALQQGGPSLQGAVVEELQRAHFVRGENLGDHDVLVHAATSAGLVGARGALDTGAAADQVRADVVAATLRGVNAAPTFVVGNRAIVGAQEPEALLEFLRTANAPAEPSATVCALIDHADPVWAFRRAEELLDSRNPLDALKALRPVLADYGDNTSVLLLAARAHFASAQLGRAESTLRRILELDPTDHYAVFMLGRTLQRQGRADEARTQFRLAAAMSPQQDHLEALADLG